MGLCYPWVCIWSGPIYKIKLTQIAIYATSVANKIIKGFVVLDVMINWDRIKVAFLKKKKKKDFFFLKSCGVNYTSAGNVNNPKSF